MLVGAGTARMQRGSHAADAKLKQYIFEKTCKNFALSVVPQMAAALSSGQASSAGVASALESVGSKSENNMVRDFCRLALKIIGLEELTT